MGSSWLVRHVCLALRQVVLGLDMCQQAEATLDSDIAALDVCLQRSSTRSS